ncbi:MAG: hypothetical protein ACHQFW_04795, partial [Chitinophagales bacterium]
MKIISTLSFFLFFAAKMFAQSGEQVFNSSGMFTVPPDVNSVTIEVIGAGGSGGFNGTGGGSGGGFASGTYSVLPLEILAVVIGVPGINAFEGSTYVNTAAVLILATGGENGVSVPNPDIGGGGIGGTGIGGTISNFTGGNGGGGFYTYFGGGGGGAAGPSGNGIDGGNTIAWTGICNTPGGEPGVGGGTPAGDGGKGAGFTDDFCTVTDPAGNGALYGGGGGGGNGNGGGPGNGAGGWCKISWCDVNTNLVATEGVIVAEAVDVLYQWIDCDNGNSIIDGETEAAFYPTVAGNYAVIINDGICIDTSECFSNGPKGNSINSSPENILSISNNPFT